MSRNGAKGRGDRWEEREILKENANRHGSIRSQHPQVRRQIEDGEDQEAEWNFMFWDASWISEGKWSQRVFRGHGESEFDDSHECGGG